MANRKKDTQVLQSYIPKVLYEKLRKAAEAEDKSMSECVKEILELYL